MFVDTMVFLVLVALASVLLLLLLLDSLFMMLVLVAFTFWVARNCQVMSLCSVSGSSKSYCSIALYSCCCFCRSSLALDTNFISL